MKIFGRVGWGVAVFSRMKGGRGVMRLYYPGSVNSPEGPLLEVQEDLLCAPLLFGFTEKTRRTRLPKKDHKQSQTYNYT